MRRPRYRSDHFSRTHGTHGAIGSRAPCADGWCYRTQQSNAHRTEEREVLYPWHPWSGRVVWIHKAFEKRASDVFRCSLHCDEAARSLELPAWMFDRVACASVRLATAPQVNCAALSALQACLAAVVSGSLGGAVQQDSPISGAGRGSCNQNREAAHARKARRSRRPPPRNRTIRTVRTVAACCDERACLEPIAGRDTGSGNQADGAPPSRSRSRRVRAGRRTP